MTLFDVITVTCFIAIVAIYLFSKDQSPRMLVRLMLAVVILATANQAGNQGYVIVAAALVAAAMTFVAMQILRRA